MRIAMHQSHHWLPFWDEPRQPKDMFDPKRYGNLKMVVAGEKLLARNTRLWPVLAGLHAVDMPVMAHVSAFCNCKGEGTYHYCRPTWVQITSIPDKTNRRGIPLVLKNGKLMVEHLWVGNDERGDPYQFLDREDLLPSSVGHSPQYWTDFFLGKLHWLIQEAQKGSEADLSTRCVTMPA